MLRQFLQQTMPNCYLGYLTNNSNKAYISYRHIKLNHIGIYLRTLVQVYDPETDSLGAERTYGCLPPEEKGRRTIKEEKKRERK